MQTCVCMYMRVGPARLHMATRRMMRCGDTPQATETTMSMAGKLEQRESECEALRRAVSRLESAATEAGNETPNAATVAARRAGGRLRGQGPTIPPDPWQLPSLISSPTPIVPYMDNYSKLHPFFGF